MKFAPGIFQAFFLFGGEQFPRAYIFPPAHRFHQVGRTRMARHARGIDHHRGRTIPRRSFRRAVFPHIRLRADRGLAAPILRPRAHASPPAEIKAREVLLHQRRFGTGIFDDFCLELFGREDVEGIGAGLKMPAEMALRRALDEERHRLELVHHA